MENNNNLCLKKDGFGNTCQRDKAHAEYCIYTERKDENTYTFTSYQAGWIDQGDRPARRKFFLWIVCAIGMLGIMAFIMSMSWYGWIALGLMSVVFLMGVPEVLRMYRQYRAEAMKK